MLRRAAVLLVGIASSLCLQCGSSEDSGSCDPLSIEGTPFGSNGTATLVGTGTLPDAIPNGLDLQLLLASDGVSRGVLPENLFAPSVTCGRSLTYTIGKITAGTYRLEFEILDPDSDDFVTLYEGTSSETFSIAEGQTVTFDAMFAR